MQQIIFFLTFLFAVSSFACTEGEVLSSTAGEYQCDNGGWRDPRGLVWFEGQDCELSGLRVPATDELKNHDAELALTGSGYYCVKYVIHHYFSFPRTPAEIFTGDILDFYSTKDAYGEFSNFSGFPVFMDGEWWSTSEHYYQAQKYETEEMKDYVQFAGGPMEAANRGRDPKFPKRKDWDQVKDSFMEKVLFDKYQRHPELTELILSTGNSHIYEHTTNDCYWGDCGDRTGKNRLGTLLMKVRDSLR
ncbi:MAG: NADAR family protein [Bdellovibrionota bacterium]